MKAAMYYKDGGPEVFSIEEVERPVCTSNGVLIKVSAASVEGSDQISREIVPPASTPHTAGYQCAGEVVEVGSAVRTLTVGQRVVCVLKSGSHAEYVVAPAAMTWALPAGTDVKLASAIAAQPPSSFDAIRGSGLISPDLFTSLVYRGV